MSNNKAKRNRGNNFSKDEELLLLAEISKFKKIIECKITDKINSSEKNEAWEKIVTSFNAKNTCTRSLDQVKVKYDNLKCKARKLSAENKKYIIGTGGGPAGTSDLDPVIEAVINIINKTSVVGLHNPFDSDCVNVEVDENEMDHELGDEDWNNLIIIQSSENLSRPNTENEKEYNPIIKNIASFPGCSNAPDQNEVLEVEEVKPAALNVNENKTNWKKNTPKKLKTPISQKLRQVVQSPCKEEHYKKKNILLDESIKKIKLEQEDILQKRDRDIAQHKKRMRLMDLEIELKQKMINGCSCK